MSHVFDELTLGSQKRFARIRRQAQYFSTFAGGVVEALRELGFRLSDFSKRTPLLSTVGGSDGPSHPRLQQAMAARMEAMRERFGGGENIELSFEQRDHDHCKVVIVPFRTDLPFLSTGSYIAQLGIELSRYSSDPDVLRQALNVNSRGKFGRFLGGLGGQSVPKLTLDSPADLRQPGSMTFELQGARLVVAMNVVTDLGRYRLSDFDLDIETLKSDLEAYFYGLEKYLSLLLQNFGSDVTVEPEPASESMTLPPQPQGERLPPGPQSRTVPLSALQPPEFSSVPPDQPPHQGGEGSPPGVQSRTVPLSALEAPNPLQTQKTHEPPELP